MSVVDREALPWGKKSPDGPYDYVVIGSGMGGMCAAALLAKLGRRVLVLEQHYVPGGFTHTFRRKGWVFDVGVHAVGEVTTHSAPGRLLEALTDGRLAWTSLGKVYEEFHFPGGFRLDFPDRPEVFRANLAAAFPGELSAIDLYLRKVRQIAGDMKSYYLARTLPPRLGGWVERHRSARAQAALGLTVESVVSGLTASPELRRVLTAQWGYYGSPPSRASFAMQALVTKHFLHGGYYPVGGSKRIAIELLQTVAKAGGWTRIHADVERILVERGRAVGVRLVGGEVVRARLGVISAAGVRATVERLLTPDVASEEWAQSIRRLDPAPAHVCLYLGFKGDIRKAGASAANQWFYESWRLDDETWRLSDREAPVLYTSFPSLKDPTHDPGPEQLHTAEVVTFIPYGPFAKWAGARWQHRGADYEALKAELTERILAQFFRHMPALKPMIAWTELSTPASTEHFTRPIAGSIYVLEPTPECFKNPWLRPRSPVPGLGFAGSEVATVGVVGALMGGAFAATAAEPLAAVPFLRSIF